MLMMIIEPGSGCQSVESWNQKEYKLQRKASPDKQVTCTKIQEAHKGKHIRGGKL